MKHLTYSFIIAYLHVYTNIFVRKVFSSLHKCNIIGGNAADTAIRQNRTEV